MNQYGQFDPTNTITLTVSVTVPEAVVSVAVTRCETVSARSVDGEAVILALAERAFQV